MLHRTVERSENWSPPSGRTIPQSTRLSRHIPIPYDRQCSAVPPSWVSGERVLALPALTEDREGGREGGAEREKKDWAGARGRYALVRRDDEKGRC